MAHTTLSGSSSAEPPDGSTVCVGIQFTETMRGHFSTAVLDDYQRADEKARQDNSSCEFTLTVTSGDLDRMLADPSHAAKLSGTVTVPVLDPQPLTVIRGEFNLFVRSPDYVNARLMCYRMLLASGSRTKFYFDGFKVARDDPGFDLWSDTTTLYITIFRGEDSQAPILGRGILQSCPRTSCISSPPSVPPMRPISWRA